MINKPFGMVFLLTSLLSVISLSSCALPSNSQTVQPTVPSTQGTSSPELSDPSSLPSKKPLTPEQEQKRAQKQEEVRQQIEAVLTSEQVQQFQAKLNGGEKMRNVLKELTLDASQKIKIQEILKTAYHHREKQNQQS